MSDQKTSVPDVGAKVSPSAITGFRPEIQALRALAVTLVIVYHLATPLLPGGYIGVDVFFVISGYLITSHLGKELRTTGTIKFRNFYLKRAKRLLPMALLVLLASLVATIAFLPRLYWVTSGLQISASSLYFENWLLAGNSVNYLAQANAQSPVQQYWSLSLEEQFYLFWPLALVVVAFLSNRANYKLTRSLVFLVVLVGAGSLTGSILLTNFAPGLAYFITPTRMWEFCLGAIVWLLAEKSKLPSWANNALSLTGMAVIFIAAFTFNDLTPFPGYLALIPCLGAVFVIWAGTPRRKNFTASIYGFKPIQWLGNVSYSAYLWHWPLLIILPFAIGAALSPTLRIVILLATLILSAISKPLVEDVFIRGRFSGLRPKKFLLFFGSLTALLALSGFFVSQSMTKQLAVDKANFESGTGFVQASMGANSIEINGYESPGDVLFPPPLVAQEDFITQDSFNTECMHHKEFSQVDKCIFGSTRPDALSVALVGDSHAAQWIPALDVAGKQNNWKITTYLRASCPLSETYRIQASEFNNACPKWVKQVSADLGNGDYKLVLVSAFSMHTYNSPSGERGVAEGMAQALQPAIASGAQVAFIRDTPIPQTAGQADVPACVDRYRDALTHCSFSRGSAVLNDPQKLAASLIPGAAYLDLSQYFCDQSTCFSVIGNVVVYKDGDHISATYSKTMGSIIATELAPYLEKAGNVHTQ